MTRRPIRYALLFAAGLAAWQPSKARADSEDTQIWLLAYARGKLDKDVHLVVDSSYRVREPVFGADQQTIRVSVEKAFEDDMRFGGGVALFQTGSVSEYRLHQQFRYLAGGLDLRTRLEQRWFEGADRVELRIRQRIQYARMIAPRVEASASSEWFGIVQSRDTGGERGTEQIRNIIGVTYDISETLSLGPGYMLQITPRDGRPDAISHVPQFTLNYRF